MLLTCPWSEQPPTEAPEIEDDEEVVRLEFVDGEVKGFYDKQEDLENSFMQQSVKSRSVWGNAVSAVGKKSI